MARGRGAARAPPRRGRRSARGARRRRAARGRRARSPRRPSPSAARATRRSAPRGRTRGRRDRRRACCAARAVTSPSRAMRSRNRSGAAAISSSASSQPSTRVGDELLQHPERRGERRAGVLVPAAERRHVREAVRAEEAQQLELGVDARLEPAEELEDQLRRRRRPSVFDCSDATSRAGAELAVEPREVRRRDGTRRRPARPAACSVERIALTSSRASSVSAAARRAW